MKDNRSDDIDNDMEYMMNWNGIDDGGMDLKSLFHYDIILEKYGKLVKIGKLVKYRKIGPSSLKKMPATIHGLRKLPIPLNYPINY